MAKFTLRKAAKIRTKIEGRIGELRNEIRNTIIQVNVNDPLPTSQITKAENKYLATFTEALLLTDTLSDIRERIGTVNATAGINTILTRVADIDSRLKTLALVTSSEPRLSDEAITARVEAEKNRTTVAYSRDDQHYSILSEKVIGEVKTQETGLRRMREWLQDQIEKLNGTNEIEIGQETVDFLTTEGII